MDGSKKRPAEGEPESTAVPSTDVKPTIEPCDVHVLLADDEKISRLVTTKLLRLCVAPPARGEMWRTGVAKTGRKTP
jgi:hypothetical protein